MRLIFIYPFTLLSGVAIAAGIAALVGILLPSWKIPVFLVITVFWLVTGWGYAQARDRGRF
jgi:hypothetical protein